MDAAPSSLSLERIAQAARSIDPVFVHSPQFVSGALGDQPCGGNLTVEQVQQWLCA